MTTQSRHLSSPLQRVSRRRPCPMCGKPDWCSVSADDRIAVCMRERSDRPARNGGWTHVLTTGDSSPPIRPQPKPAVPKPVPVAAQIASVDHRHEIYSRLLREHLVLSDAHCQALLARGLTEFEIQANGYRSTPSAIYATNIARALDFYGLDGVPGFYRQGSQWQMVPMRPGYFVPYRDERGRIQGMQYRLDEPLNDGKTKYLWLSSADRQNGASSGAPVHFSRVHRIRETGEALLTEGALKADVVSQFLDVGVIAVAGTSAFNDTFGERLKEVLPNLRHVTLAYDSDWRQKPQVKAALEKLMRMLGRAGFTVRVRTWPTPYKGLDDYLLALSQRERGRAA